MRKKDREEVDNMIEAGIDNHANTSVAHSILWIIAILVITCCLVAIYHLIYVVPYLPRNIQIDSCALLQEALNASSHDRTLNGDCYICWQECMKFDNNKTACETNQQSTCKYYKVS